MSLLDFLSTMPSATVVYRYDATPEIGLGHAVRVETLAAALTGRGAQCHHVVPASTGELLQQRGMPASSIVSLESDEWLKLQLQASHIVFDTLWSGNARNTAREIHQLKTTSQAHLTVIDSMPPDHYTSSRSQLEPDLLVTPYHRAAMFRSAPRQAYWLHGEEFALLSAEYQDLANQPKTPAKQHKVLVCTGGNDVDQLSLRIALSLSTLADENKPQIDIVVGPMYSKKLTQDLVRLKSTNPQIGLHWHPSSIASLIHKSTLVVGRPGLMRYEAACLGTPALLLSTSTDYREYFEQFSNAGLAEIFFQTDEQGENDFISRLKILISRPPAINTTSMKMVDAMGPIRIAETMLDMNCDNQKLYYAN